MGWRSARRTAPGACLGPTSRRPNDENSSPTTRHGILRRSSARAWLITFLSRKTVPKDAPVYIARSVITGRGRLANEINDQHRLAAELLGLSQPEWGKPHPITRMIELSPTRITTALLAIAVAASENATSKETWRHPDPDAAAYFTALREWGYTLSDVENIVLGIVNGQPSTEGTDTKEGEGED